MTKFKVGQIVRYPISIRYRYKQTPMGIGIILKIPYETTYKLLIIKKYKNFNKDQNIVYFGEDDLELL
jgi:hypothetical protein